MSFPQILSGPDISNWPETATITHVEFQSGNFIVRHSKESGPGAWGGAHVPGWGNIDKGGTDPGNIQWTLWVVIPVNGQMVTGGCIGFWPGQDKGVGGPFSDGARNWWYQIAGMAGHQPGPGELIGVIAVAGYDRLADVELLQERSNVCYVTVPQNDTGVYDFAPPVVVPVPVPEPIPVPIPPTPIPDPPVPVPVPVPVPLPPSLPPSQITQLLGVIVTAFQTINTKLDRCATHADIVALQAELAKAEQTLATIFIAPAVPVPATAVPATPVTATPNAMDAIATLAKLFKK